jgi:glucoamylase
MFRNVASDGFVSEDPDPAREDVLSAPGCILAAPRYTQTHPGQDYVYNWTRDAAVVAANLNFLQAIIFHSDHQAARASRAA